MPVIPISYSTRVDVRSDQLYIPQTKQLIVMPPFISRFLVEVMPIGLNARWIIVCDDGVSAPLNNESALKMVAVCRRADPPEAPTTRLHLLSRIDSLHLRLQDLGVVVPFAMIIPQDHPPQTKYCSHMTVNNTAPRFKLASSPALLYLKPIGAIPYAFSHGESSVYLSIRAS